MHSGSIDYNNYDKFCQILSLALFIEITWNFNKRYNTKIKLLKVSHTVRY